MTIALASHPASFFVPYFPTFLEREVSCMVMGVSTLLSYLKPQAQAIFLDEIVMYPCIHALFMAFKNMHDVGGSIDRSVFWQIAKSCCALTAMKEENFLLLTSRGTNKLFSGWVWL